MVRDDEREHLDRAIQDFADVWHRLEVAKERVRRLEKHSAATERAARDDAWTRVQATIDALLPLTTVAVERERVDAAETVRSQLQTMLDGYGNWGDDERLICVNKWQMRAWVRALTPSGVGIVDPSGVQTDGEGEGAGDAAAAT